MTDIAIRLLPDELENPAILQIGRLPARSNMIPAQTKAFFYRNKNVAHLVEKFEHNVRAVGKAAFAFDPKCRKTVLKLFRIEQ